MKADRFNSLHIAKQSNNVLRTEYVVSSDTDTWSVTERNNEWGVVHRGRTYRTVTSTPQGKTILQFVQDQLANA